MKGIVVHPACWVGTVLAALTLVAQAVAQAPTAKPRVPPGIDPGGVAIAIIGNGIDYTRPDIASRLARDGEGEIIGWDFVDDDRRPYVFCQTPTRRSDCATHELIPLLRLRMAPFRVSLAHPQSLVSAVQAIAQTDIRIVALMLDPPPPRAFLLDAAKRFPTLVFVGTVDSGDRYIAIGDKERQIRSSMTTAEIVARTAACPPSSKEIDVIVCTTTFAESHNGRF